MIKKILWAIFGNDDDPRPPDWYELPYWLKVAFWYCRNPVHNLFTYTLGFKGKEYTQTGRLPEHNFIPSEDGGGFNWRIIWWRKLPFPFFSYVTYNQAWHWLFKRVLVGWRDNGALGAGIKPAWWWAAGLAAAAGCYLILRG